jgi:hypothetical protein
MCTQQNELLTELTTKSGKIKLTMYVFMINGKARKLKVNKIPATIVSGKKDYRIRFFGVTAGYEFTSLVKDIAMVLTAASI